MQGIVKIGVILALTALVPFAAGAAERTVSYNQYQYNYPHEIPPDYVYRTGRVFSPQELARGSAEPEKNRAGAVDPLGPPITALAAQLLASSSEDLDEDYGVVVSTLVNLANLYATSSFGRLVSERLLGELQRAGLKVLDVRKTPGLLISGRHGEYSLSRDMDELAFRQAAQAVLVGTYTVTGERVLVDIRLLRNRDNQVLASARHDFDASREVLTLLADEGMPVGRGAAVPVRALAQPERSKP